MGKQRVTKCALPDARFNKAVLFGGCECRIREEIDLGLEVEPLDNIGNDPIFAGRPKSAGA